MLPDQATAVASGAASPWPPSSSCCVTSRLLDVEGEKAGLACHPDPEGGLVPPEAEPGPVRQYAYVPGSGSGLPELGLDPDPEPPAPGPPAPVPPPAGTAGGGVLVPPIEPRLGGARVL